MRSNVALSVVIVVFGAVVASPQQLVEPFTESAYGQGWQVPLGDGHGSWIPIIYIVVALILYRLLSAPLEVSLERGGRPRHILAAQVAALVVAAFAGGYYVWSSVTYFDSLSFLERAPASLVGPQVVVQNAIFLGGAVYLAGTVLALLVAASAASLTSRATAPGQAVPGEAVPGNSVPGEAVPGNSVPGRPALDGPALGDTAFDDTASGRAYRGAGITDLAVCAAVGAVQNWDSAMPSPLWSVGLGLAGVGLVLAVNLGRQVPALVPRAAAPAPQGPGMRAMNPGGGKSQS